MVEPNLGILFSVGVLAILGFKARFVELVLLLLVMLLLSDSRQDSLYFFQSAKKVGMILFGLLVWLSARKYELEKNIIFLTFSPFLLWSLGVALFLSPEVNTSIQKTVSYGILFFAVPSLVQILMKNDRERFLRSLVMMIAVYLAIGFLLYLGGREISQLAGRFRGLMGNPNGLGIISFLFIILFDTVNTRHPDLFTKRVTLLIWGLLLVNIILCGSRSALAAVLIFMIFRSFKVFRGFLGVLIFVSSLFAYQSFTLALPQIIEALNLSEYLRIETLETGSGRLIAWEFAWSQIQEAFYTGKGFNYTELLFGENYKALSRLGHQGNAHNSFLTFWLDTGLVGLSLYMIAFFLIFFKVSKISKNGQAIMYAVLFSLTFESWLTASLNPMTITLLIIISIIIYGAENEESEQAPKAGPIQ
ncbi:MAG: O-antigen ligase family protein, partial [Flavobacteriales bacterium]|nr:O-antigen ligase family protein [Flavobacteriales bacterium]